VRGRRAAIGTAAFFVLASCVEAGLGPWVLTQWRTGPWPTGTAWQVAGIALGVAGLALLLHTFTRFAVDGGGTPTPLAPPRRLVVVGAYRWLRNPQYVATAAIIAGQGLLLGQPILLGGAAAYLLAFVLVVRRFEEPLLVRRFGAEYEAYRRAVPGWWPRRRPWEGNSSSSLENI
jgi:protein-S-isoprenylcysteine O-methyltransferase Ste14